jgi:RHS repeat-associated protein
VPNTFQYNGDGKRVLKQDSSGTLKAVWDGENILIETNQNNVTQAVYTLTPAAYGKLVSQRQSGATQYFLFDGIGSTSNLTNSAGTVTDTYIYRAFGPLQVQTGTTTNAFRYFGRVGYYLLSDLGRYYIRARHYDPTIGQFLSPDPLGFARADAVNDSVSPHHRGIFNVPFRALSFGALSPDPFLIAGGAPPNQRLWFELGTLLSLPFDGARYVYVVNSPLKYSDPSGLWPQPCTPADHAACLAYCIREFGAGATGKCIWVELNWIPATFPFDMPKLKRHIECDCECKGPGKCDQATYDLLSDAKDKACRKTKLISYKKKPKVPPWTKQEAQDMATKWLNCAIARKAMDDRCFLGGNVGHRRQTAMALLNYTNCMILAIKP